MKQLFLLAALPGALLAQSLEGTWQGTLSPSNQNRESRVVLQIARNGNLYQGKLYNLEQGRQFNLGAITLQGSAVKIAIPGLGTTYDGKLEADGNSLTGTINQGANTLPLPLKRATAESAWELPPPPAAPKGLPEGTKLEYEVAVIEPSPEGLPGHGLNVSAGEFRARNSSLADLITFVYGLHLKQISGLPGWAETERYDILAKLPPQGEPTDLQLRAMTKHLIQSRFNLAFHMEKRELSVYAISTGKDGPAGIRMVKNDTSGFSVGAQGLGRVRFRGASMADFANTLQTRVLDRPVIDQTGLSGRFDFMLNWTPDEFQFPEASAAQRSNIPAGPDAPPDLFTAIQQQLGLKLGAAKTAVDVFVIEKVSRPSEN